MFGFPLIAVPFSFLTLSAWFFGQSEQERLSKYFGRGFLLAIPCLLVHLLLYGIIPEAPGSLLSLFRIWWERFFLPSALGIGAYRLLHSFDETIRPGVPIRRYAAFLFGYFTLFGVAFTLRSYGSPDPFALFFFPALSVASIFLIVYFTDRIVVETGGYRALMIAAAVLASFALAGTAYLFNARLEWLGGILAMILLAVGVYLGRFLLK